MKNSYEIIGNEAIITVKVPRTRIVLRTKIDLCDLEKAKSLEGTWTCTYSRRTESYYIVGWAKGYGGREKGMTVNLSRYLFDEIPEGMVVDHYNHDTLDNRRSVNLRIVTQQVNRNNRKPKNLKIRKTGDKRHVNPGA
ncbi:HNH endonuclease [Paenibacillus sp. XY044]|uniref:HNH endonuclease n=1 Tax=Paenibacillus sp. XY044 TaxID=2026089 RepID=UPI000B9963F7|nr:HNH endonuclease [Paenibacillus sp. XY044]OZB90075.1 hypothetical protein CJP46_35440 [Paenibacillus sp. XY044]